MPMPFMIWLPAACIFTSSAGLLAEQQQDAGNNRQNRHSDFSPIEIETDDGKQSGQDEPDAQEDHAKVL